MSVTTKAQRAAVKRLFDRSMSDYVEALKRGESPPAPPPYRVFRRQFRKGFGDDYIIGPWAGMWIGIERDGYTHS